MRYFLDTEFIEDGKTVELLSIGITCVTDDVNAGGRKQHTFYMESMETDRSKANQWVKDNVLVHLEDQHSKGYSHEDIREGVLDFVTGTAQGSKPEFWGYYADYDWVVFCQLFGTMMDLPKGWPMFCMDIKQLAMMLGNPDLPKQSGVEHNALADAVWNEMAFDFLRTTLTKDYGRFLAREMLR